MQERRLCLAAFSLFCLTIGLAQALAYSQELQTAQIQSVPSVADDGNEGMNEQPLVLVLSPPVFESALQSWFEFRQAQGYEIMYLPLARTNSDGSRDMSIQETPVATPEEIREKIRKVAQQREIAAIMLVGDGAPVEDAPYMWRDVVPAPRVAARVVQVFGSEPLLASDGYYADLNEDGVPDLPIGRLPVETPEQLREVIEKIIRYETDSPVGNWTRRINIISGPNGLDLRVIGSSPETTFDQPAKPSGLGMLVDTVVEKAARKLFSEYLPQEFSTSLTQFSTQSVFCPYPPDFEDTVVERLNEGSLFTIYAGHGRVFGLDRYVAPNGKDYGILEINDCQRLDCPRMSPIALFFACYAGAYDAKWRSLGEELLLTPDGPVAVLAASRRTAPYGMCVLGASMMDVAFNSSYVSEDESIYSRTLGELIFRAQNLAAYTNDSSPVDSKNDDLTDESSLSEEIEFDESTEEVESEELGQWRGHNARKPQRTNRDYVGGHLDWINERLQRSLREEDKRRENDSFRQFLDQTAKIFDPTANRLDEQIMDHIAEFNLLGDPLLQIKFPTRIDFEAPDVAYSTKTIQIQGEIPIEDQAEAYVQVELLLADFRSTVQKGKRERVFAESEEAREEYNTTYRKANDFVVDAMRAKTENGRFTTEIMVPQDFSGECVLRVAAVDGRRYYIGSRKILVRPHRGNGS